jgi:uncharacterized membrane protein YhfC
MNKSIVIEFVTTISETELKWLTQRLNDRLSGDLADALAFMGKHKGMDGMLSSAISANELFDMCDNIKEILHKECKKKKI